mmetsp:Transcript_21153/g.55047  ORF Transcript_21153/g.55047 Transcript_21153/m.55047 type:complete len:689 (-) Transcript_21153:2899-4965(-)
MDLLSRGGLGVSIRPKKGPPVGGFVSSTLPRCTCDEVPRREHEREEADFPTRFDLEFDLDECRAAWGWGGTSGIEFVDPRTPNWTALNQFVETLCQSLGNEAALGGAFDPGSVHVGLGHRLVQPYPGAKYIKHSMLLCTVSTRDLGEHPADSLARLEDAVLNKLVTAGVEMPGFEAYSDPEGGSDATAFVPVFRAFGHNQWKRSRPRASSLLRTFPSFARHAHRVVPEVAASSGPTTNGPLDDAAKTEQANRLCTLREARAHDEAAELAVRAQEELRRREEEAQAQRYEERAAAAAARAEKAVQLALERRRRDKKEERARCKVENDAAYARERSYRTEEARALTHGNVQSARDAEERAERLAAWRHEAEWLAYCDRAREENESRRLQGIAAIEWGGTAEAEAKRQYEAERAERTEKARNMTRSHIAQARYELLEQWAEGDIEERSERVRWEREMRERHAKNKIEGEVALRLAQEEKKKIDTQNARYKQGRDNIKDAKTKSAEALRLKIEREAREEAARIKEEKRFRREEFHKREAARVETMKRAKEATAKEMRRVARQDVRRDINKRAVPRSEAQWLDILNRLGQGSPDYRQIDSDEFLTFLNGPKHREFVKWYVKREAGEGGDNVRSLPRWLPLDAVLAAVAQYCQDLGLQKEAPQVEDSVAARLKREAQERAPWCPAQVTSPTKRR